MCVNIIAYLSMFVKCVKIKIFRVRAKIVAKEKSRKYLTNLSKCAIIQAL